MANFPLPGDDCGLATLANLWVNAGQGEGSTVQVRGLQDKVTRCRDHFPGSPLPSPLGHQRA